MAYFAATVVSKLTTQKRHWQQTDPLTETAIQLMWVMYLLNYV